LAKIDLMIRPSKVGMNNLSTFYKNRISFIGEGLMAIRIVNVLLLHSK